MNQKKRGKSQFTYKARWLSFHKQRKHNNEFLARVRTLQRWCTFCFHNLHTHPLLLPKERMKFKDLRKKRSEIFRKTLDIFSKTLDFFKNSSEFSYHPLPPPKKNTVIFPNCSGCWPACFSTLIYLSYGVFSPIFHTILRETLKRCLQNTDKPLE